MQTSIPHISQISSIIEEYGLFISQMEENHKREELHENLISIKPITEKIYEIINMKIENSTIPPFKIFLQEEIHNYINAGILKTIDHRGLQEGFYKYIYHEKLEELTEMLFWLFLIIKYPIITGDEESYARILKEYRKKISNHYVTFIILLPHHQKENLLNLLIFSIAYIVLMIFCKHFPNEKFQISNRFLLDIFHIILFELNGVCVSDYYVQNMIEKMFTYKFLTFYKEYGNFKKPESPSRKPKNFLGNPIVFPDSSYNNIEIQSFSHELSSILYKNIDFNRKTKTIIKSSKENSPRKNYKFESMDSRKTTDISPISTNKASSNIFVTNPTLEENNYINKMKFDCCQISPTISNMLENGKMSLPHIKKKMINHPIDKSIEGTQHKNPLTHNKDPEKVSFNSTKKKFKNSVLESYSYTTNDLTDDYRTDSKYLKDLYEMKFVLDLNHQKTSQLPSSKKLFDNFNHLNQKSESDYLIDQGYSPHCIESLRHMKDGEMRKLQLYKSEQLPKIDSQQNKTEMMEERSAMMDSSPKLNNVGKIKGKFKSIVNIAEKQEEKPSAYAMIPRILNPIILEKNQTLEEEMQRLKMESSDTDNLVREKQGNELNYKDQRKKYREEHSTLIRGNIDSNINLLVNNIIQKKEAATRNIMKLVKTKKNPNLLRRKHLKEN